MFLVKYKLGLQDRCNQNKFWCFIIKKKKIHYCEDKNEEQTHKF